MSTHNICFCGEIRKILCGYPHLYVAMQLHKNQNLEYKAFEIFRTFTIHLLTLQWYAG